MKLVHIFHFHIIRLLRCQSLSQFHKYIQLFKISSSYGSATINYFYSAFTPNHNVSFIITHRSASFARCPDGYGNRVIVLPRSGWVNGENDGREILTITYMTQILLLLITDPRFVTWVSLFVQITFNNSHHCLSRTGGGTRASVIETSDCRNS
jgi:hypothetical protein